MSGVAVRPSGAMSLADGQSPQPGPVRSLTPLPRLNPVRVDGKGHPHDDAAGIPSGHYWLDASVATALDPWDSAPRLVVLLTPGRSCPAHAPLATVGCYAYASAHARIRRALGPASAYRCAFGCGERAAHWALCGELDGLPTEDRGGSPMPYSFDLTRYRPLCRADHARYDSARRRALRLGLPLPAAPPPPQHVPEPLFDDWRDDGAANAGPETRRYWAPPARRRTP